MYLNDGEMTPVIIYLKCTINEIRDCIIENYGQIKYELPFINAVSVEIPKEKIDKLAKNNMIGSISEDAIVSKTPIFPEARSVRATCENFEEDMERIFGSTERGKGVGVAVIDTGVAPHYDLIKPNNRITAFKDLLANKEMPYDDDGHGTHVAGIIAGNGYTSCKYTGTAPCANIIAIKALDDSGNGTESDILAALQWIVNNGSLYNIRVINLSLGIKVESPSDADPLVKGANAAVQCGYSVVTAAGNNGPGRFTINSPGISPMVITVGAADMTRCDEDGEITVARFSSRGPTFSGDAKPDLLAPGVEVYSLDGKNLKGYAVQSGTSMAAPVVSGVAACLYAINPCLTPAQVKKILLRDALPLSKEDRNAQGCGLLNYKMFLNL
ncbi:MAG: S8 family peptidase [Eubacteriales bacterium]|nr:S8 family peptidase [Eubacteriales bacterium]MDD3199075.1 S8 family peptidase [Eubacteriales bacterium]MDD4629682.1 S8 family peptidase [Eubacteriales bacterium]